MTGKKILVSGANGFIGRRLIPKLLEKDYQVTALCRYVTGRKLLGKDVEYVIADLKDEFAVRKVIRTVHPERVVHLGAISAVSHSYDHPQEVAEVNYIGTINLAEACLREVPYFKQFIFAGTSEVYGNQPSFPIIEDAKRHPNSPYAVAKAASEMYLEYMRDAYEFPVTISRCFNTYGRTGNVHFVTEKILSQMLNGLKEIRLGDPDPVRDLMYVNDHINAYLSVTGNEKAVGRIFNFCTGKGYTIKELVEHCAEATGWKGNVIWHTMKRRPLDIHTLIGCNTLAEKLLGWKPEYGLKEGLEKTINNLTQT